MPRRGFLMTIKPGTEIEYKKRHDEIWPELSSLLKASTIRNYSIFLHGLTLFAYLEYEDGHKLDSLKDHDVMKKWWRYMEPLMECNPDNSPKVTELNCMFHLD